MWPKCELVSKVAARTPFGRGGIQPLEDTVENLKIPFTYNLRLRPIHVKRAFGNYIRAWREPALSSGCGQGLGDCNAGLPEPQRLRRCR